MPKASDTSVLKVAMFCPVHLVLTATFCPRRDDEAGDDAAEIEGTKAATSDGSRRPSTIMDARGVVCSRAMVCRRDRGQ